MWPVNSYLSMGAVWVDAVFASGLQRCDEPSAGQVRQAVTAAIRVFGCSGCAGRVAQEFGDHPETAVIRMRWARAVAGEAFADPAPEPRPGEDAGGPVRQVAWSAVAWEATAGRPPSSEMRISNANRT